MRIFPKNWTVGWDINASIKAGNFVHTCFMLDFARKDPEEQNAIARFFQKNPEKATEVLNGLLQEKLDLRFVQLASFLGENAGTALAIVPAETFSNFVKGANLNAQKEFGDILAAAQKAGVDHKVMPAIKEVLKDELTKLHPIGAWAVERFPPRVARAVPHFPTHMVEGLMPVNPALVKATIKEAVAEMVRDGNWHMPAHFMRDAHEKGISPREYLGVGQVKQLEAHWMGKSRLERDDVKTYSDFVTVLSDYGQFLLSGLSAERLQTAAVFLHTDMKQAFNTRAEFTTQTMKRIALNNFVTAVNGHPNQNVSRIVADTLNGLGSSPHLRN